MHSFGQLGLTTGAFAPEVTLKVALPKFTVETDFRGGSVIVPGVQIHEISPSIGQFNIGGSLIGGNILANLDIGAVKIGGSIRGGSIVSTAGAIGSISIGGDIVGTAAAPVLISGFGRKSAPLNGLDVAIKSLTVKGSVEHALINAGGTTNADASIGAILVGRGWLASSVQAGAATGGDGFVGTLDDAKLAGAGVRDVAGRFSTIASVLVKGQALGSTAGGDSFGIVAEQIVKVKLGKLSPKLDKGENDSSDFFFLAPTGTAAGSDFIGREI